MLEIEMLNEIKEEIRKLQKQNTTYFNLEIGEQVSDRERALFEKDIIYTNLIEQLDKKIEEYEKLETGLEVLNNEN